MSCRVVGALLSFLLFCLVTNANEVVLVVEGQGTLKFLTTADIYSHDYSGVSQNELERLSGVVRERMFEAQQTAAGRKFWPDPYEDEIARVCHDDELLFELNIALKLARVGAPSGFRAKIEEQFEEFLAAAPESLPADISISPDELSDTLNLAVEVDQFFASYPFQESYRNVKSSFGDNAMLVSAFEDLVARHNCGISAEGALLAERVLDQYSWPTDNKFGIGVERAMFLLIQHADMNIALQQRSLNILKQKLDADELRNPSRYAYLYDRLGLKVRGLQKYGTQVECIGGEYYQPSPLEDPEKLDELRAAMGMVPIQKYLAMVPGCGNAFPKRNQGPNTPKPA